MSGVVGIGLRLAMGAALTTGFSLDTGGGLQESVDRREQDAYFREVLPGIVSYDPNGSFGVEVGVDKKSSLRYYSVNLDKLSFVNQDLSRIRYKVLEIRDIAGNDVAAIKTLEDMGGEPGEDVRKEVKLKVRETVDHDILSFARFRLTMEIPVELNQIAVAAEKGSHMLGRVNVKIESVERGSWTEKKTVDGEEINMVNPITSVSYTHDKSHFQDTQQVYVLGLNSQGYADISGSGKSAAKGRNNYHVTFAGNPMQLELINIVGMELFNYDMTVDLKTGKVTIDP